MKKLNEKNMVKNQLFYHGTTTQITKFDAPSTDKPFFVTADYDYAIDIARVPKTIFDFSDHSKSHVYIYKVTIKKNINIIDLRDPNGKDFNIMRKMFPKRMLDYFMKTSINPKTHQFDYFLFVTTLAQFNEQLFELKNAANPVKYILNDFDGGSFEDKKFKMLIPNTFDEDAMYDISDEYGDDSKEMKAFYKKAEEDLKNEAQKFVDDLILMYNNLSKKNATTLKQLKNVISFEPFNVREMFFDRLQEAGYQGFQTSENSNHVSTTESYGIWDKNALDMISIVPEENLK